MTTVLKCVKYCLYANLYNEINIDINNESVLNDKFIKAQKSNEYW